MDKYFEIPDEEMNEKYPDIKILKECHPCVLLISVITEKSRGRCICNYEPVGFAGKLDIRSGNYRIFGYNAPDCDPSAEEYGYEVCVTIPEDMEVTDEK